MRYFLLFSSLLVFFSVAVPSSFAVGKIRGHYEEVGVLPKKAQGKIVVEEFLNFGCPYCNKFWKLSKNLREEYGDRVEFVDIPILFQGQDDSPVRLYYVAQSLGKEELVKKMLFETHHKYDVNVFDPGIINYIARTLGIGEEYAAQKNADWINKKIQKGDELAQRYVVRGTPTIVLENSLKLKTGGYGSLEILAARLPETLNDLINR